MLIHCRHDSLVFHILSAASSNVCGAGCLDQLSATNTLSPSVSRVRARASWPSRPMPQVGGQPQRRVCLGVARRPRDGLAVRLRRVLPGGRDAVVVERRLAVHHELDGAADAAHGAQQDVFGVPVHRRAAVRPRPGLQVVPRAHHQGLAHDEPAGVGLPGGLQDQAAGQIAARGRHRHPVRARAGNARRRGPGSRRTRWGSRAAARTAIPPSPPTRSGRCSRSPTGSRSRRSAGTGYAAARPGYRAPARSPSAAWWCQAVPRPRSRVVMRTSSDADAAAVYL